MLLFRYSTTRTQDFQRQSRGCLLNVTRHITTVQISLSSPTEEWMKTTLLSPLCLQFQLFTSTLLQPKRELLLRSFSKAASRGRFTTSQHCSATVQAQSTPILRRKQSTSLSTTTFSTRTTMPLLTITTTQFCTAL